MSSPSLVPTQSLTLPNGDNNRFVLFGNQWLTLQNYIERALALPINQGGWDEKYGAFSDQQTVTNALTAMTNVHNLSADFGSPHLVKKQISEDPNYLLGTEPPPEIYAHIIWLSIQIQNAANSIKNYLTPARLERLLDPDRTPDPTKRAENLVQILTGRGGLQSKAESMRSRTADLLQKLTTFDGKMTAANDELLIYAGAESQILANANEIIGTLTANVESLTTQAAKAEEEWRNYTIAAISSSVGIMVISGGLLWPLAAGLGGGLGAAAVMAMEEYNSLMDKIAQEGAEVTKKTRLVTDLTDLNSQVSVVAPAMSSFIRTLQEIEGVWLGIGGNLAYIVNNYSVDQLSDYGWVIQTFEIEDAIEKWQDISDTTKEFTQNSLVSYNFDTQWGDRLAA